MRVGFTTLVTIILIGCGKSAPTITASGEKKQIEHAKITQFYAPQPLLPKGLKGTLCYGVENTKKVELSPAVEEVWPSLSHCIDISPKVKTTYTLTAYGDDGSKDSKTVDVRVGAPAPKLFDLSVNATEVKPGEKVTVCFKVENVHEVKASAGKLDKHYNCIFDNPKKTTTYRIRALGGDGQEDSGSVTVKVR